MSSYYHGKLAKPKTIHVDHGIIRPSREIFPLLKRVLKNQRRHAVLQVLVACSRVHCQFFVVQMKSDEEQMVAYTYWFPACLELWLASEDFVG